ncbi:hypothetical protein Clopa_0878 [Clostridium pasteurianum BC1]|uniref:Uncharacterized protein n=1 Tax=Clostridium pasteurianum BC1 TaxID=86416 RepID=R4K000_CLOPA|nr:hypothetical protein Clopa_0878 [Clostridium pasteurianum BC1]
MVIWIYAIRQKRKNQQIEQQKVIRGLGSF